MIYNIMAALVASRSHIGFVCVYCLMYISPFESTGVISKISVLIPDTVKQCVL